MIIRRYIEIRDDIYRVLGKMRETKDKKELAMLEAEYEKLNQELDDMRCYHAVNNILASGGFGSLRVSRNYKIRLLNFVYRLTEDECLELFEMTKDEVLEKLRYNLNIRY